MEWISVKDRLPRETSKRYWVYTKSGRPSVGYYWRDEWEMSDRIKSFEDMGYEITHWSTIEPPKD